MYVHPLELGTVATYVTVYLLHHTATARREAKHYIPPERKPKREKARGEKRALVLGNTPSPLSPLAETCRQKTLVTWFEAQARLSVSSGCPSMS